MEEDNDKLKESVRLLEEREKRRSLGTRPKVLEVKKKELKWREDVEMRTSWSSERNILWVTTWSLQFSRDRQRLEQT